MKVKRIIFEPLIEDGKPAVRLPKKDEWFDDDGQPLRALRDFAMAMHPILTRREEEVELPDPPTVYEWVECAVRDAEISRDKSVDVVNRHAAKVSPAKLCGLVLACAEFGSAAHEEATRLLAAWRKQ